MMNEKSSPWGQDLGGVISKFQPTKNTIYKPLIIHILQAKNKPKIY